jgi:hypothetical protein
MTTHINRTHWGTLFLGLAAWVGLGSIASCSSSEEPSRGGRIEHPVDPGLKAPPPPPSLAPSPASTATSAPSVDHPGLKLSPLEMAIRGDCPERAWSKNVPNRGCTGDDDCGDGFCDRGRCAPIWTCRGGYGQRCESNDWCAFRPCVGGRCSSCASDAECAGVSGLSGAKCTPDQDIAGTQRCSGVIGGGPQ